MEFTQDLICPTTRNHLVKKGSYLTVPLTKIRYPIIKGVPSFVKTSTFNEEAFKHTEPLSREAIKKEKAILRKLIHLVSIDFVAERYILKKLNQISDHNFKILNLGCGKGDFSLLLKQYGKVVGLDIALKSCFTARKVTDFTVHSSADKIPFPDEYFDVIVSKNLMGHIPYKSKDSVFAEMRRVLKNKGKMLHIIECDSKNNMWYKYLKRNGDYFQRTMIERVGHVGLELPSLTVKRLLKYGFTIKRARPLFPFIQGTSIIVNLFGHDAPNEWPFLIKFLLHASRFSRKHPYLNYFVQFVFGLIEPINLLFPLDYSPALILYCTKEL